MIISTDNTEGSLTEVQKEILVGLLLGDGAMRKKTHALLEINHSYKQKDYVDWLFQQFKEYVETPPRKRRTNQGREAYRFTTKSAPQLTYFYDMFFVNKRKTVPRSLWLTPRSLAVWYMDDGSRCDKDVYFNSQQFSKEDQMRLIYFLRTQHGVESSLNKDKRYVRIRIRSRSVSRLMNLLSPYVIDAMKYKLLL